MKISVESYYNGEKISIPESNNELKINNPTVLSIIDNALERNKKIMSYNSDYNTIKSSVNHYEK